MIELVIFLFLMFVYIKPFKGIIPLNDNEEKMLNFLLNIKSDNPVSMKQNITSKDVKSTDLVDVDTLNMYGEDKGDFFDIDLKDVMNMKK